MIPNPERSSVALTGVVERREEIRGKNWTCIWPAACFTPSSAVALRGESKIEVWWKRRREKVALARSLALSHGRAHSSFTLHPPVHPMERGLFATLPQPNMGFFRTHFWTVGSSKGSLDGLKIFLWKSFYVHCVRKFVLFLFHRCPVFARRYQELFKFIRSEL